MADILIKNMKMPKCCYETDGQVVKPCDFLEVCRRKWGGNINALDVHSEACPLVELPSHGRLVQDTDVKDIIRSGVNTDTEADTGYVCGLIDALPTIVEASNE